MAGTTTYFGVTYPTSTDYVKDGAVDIQTVATGFDSAVAIPSYNAQTGATYTFALTDVGKTVTASNASASTYTIPPTASVAWPTNTTLVVTNLGAGVVTFAAGAGVTVTNTAATLVQYGSATLVRTGLNAWTVTPKSGGASGLTLISNTDFSAQTTVNLSNILTATYSRYALLFNAVHSSAGTAINLQFRENTTNKATGYFQGYGQTSYLGTNTNAGVNNGSQFVIVTSASASQNVVSLDIYKSATQGLINGTGYNPQAGNAMFLAGANGTMTGFTGLSINTGSGNITGNVKIYGYQES